MTFPLLPVGLLAWINQYLQTDVKLELIFRLWLPPSAARRQEVPSEVLTLRVYLETLPYPSVLISTYPGRVGCLLAAPDPDDRLSHFAESPSMRSPGSKESPPPLPLVPPPVSPDAAECEGDVVVVRIFLTLPHFKHLRHSVGLMRLQFVHVHCSTEAIVPIAYR